MNTTLPMWWYLQAEPICQSGPQQCYDVSSVLIMFEETVHVFDAGPIKPSISFSAPATCMCTVWLLLTGPPMCPFHAGLVLGSLQGQQLHTITMVGLPVRSICHCADDFICCQFRTLSHADPLQAWTSTRLHVPLATLTQTHGEGRACRCA